MNIPNISHPLNDYDKLQALVRNSQYLRDLKALQGRFISPEANEFCRKYGLSFPFTQEDSKSLELQETAKHFIAGDEFTTRIIRHRNKNSFTLVRQKTKEGTKHIYYDFNPTAWLRDDRYLTVEIDLTKKKTDIIGSVSKYVDTFSKSIMNPLRMTRNKRTEVDLWTVYDMRRKEGLNFTEIARRLSGKTGNPTYSPELAAFLKMVKRAYTKAEKAINTVNKELREKN
ncbi:MAG: hypothetical protein CV087_15360 [Candidatus Brocadia sp. WS118]|nr:MAG: hypothetical protein CV087_15360 [Candidatus Brocadia sp. WS118]